MISNYAELKRLKDFMLEIQIDYQQKYNLLEETIKQNVINIQDRIDNLEKKIRELDLAPKVCENLRKEFSELRQQYAHLVVNGEKKYPNRCPICCGRGKYYDEYTQGETGRLDSLGRWLKDCHACKGTGVLWG